MMNLTSSMACEVVAQGVTHCRLQRGEAEEPDVFSWRRVTSQVSGIIVGPLTLTHYGEMRIENQRTGEVCSLFFSKQGFWDRGKPDPREVSAGQWVMSSLPACLPACLPA